MGSPEAKKRVAGQLTVSMRKKRVGLTALRLDKYWLLLALEKQ